MKSQQIQDTVKATIAEQLMEKQRDIVMIKTVMATAGKGKGEFVNPQIAYTGNQQYGESSQNWQRLG